MCTIVEDLLPASYYSSTLIGVQADQRVLVSLISCILPDLDVVLKEHDIGRVYFFIILSVLYLND